MDTMMFDAKEQVKSFSDSKIKVSVKNIEHKILTIRFSINRYSMYQETLKRKKTISEKVIPA